MRLTKFTHAAVALDKGTGVVLIDPGVFSTDSPELVRGADVVLVTHEHTDHFDVDAIRAGLAARPDLRVYAPASVTSLLGGYGEQVVTVTAGDTFEAAGFTVTAFVGIHARIHSGSPHEENTAFLVDGVYHPGDSYHLPGVPVDTLLMPTSGPWEDTERGNDFIRAIQPSRTIQIHDALFNDLGRSIASRYLSDLGTTDVPMTTIDVGESIDL